MPQVVTEITKKRPAVVVSSDAFSQMSRRMVVPLRERKPSHQTISLFVAIQPTTANGLTKESSADCSQAKSFDRQRFVKKLGELPTHEVEIILSGIQIYLGK
jgi:mRNA interferase MazF